MLTTQQALIRYSELYHSAVLSEEHDKNIVMSPVGAWILAALSTGGSAQHYSPETVDILEETLGLPIVEAYNAVNGFIENAPEELTVAAAVWLEASQGNSNLKSWMESVGSNGVELKSVIPDKKTLDAWAKENSLGLIPDFPVHPDTTTLSILATLIACKIVWNDFFISNPTPEALQSWNVKNILSSYTGHQKVYSHDDETYGVQVALSKGVAVLSVIADESVPADQVLKEAMRLGAEFSSNRNLHNSDGPVADEGSFWSIKTVKQTGFRLPDEKVEVHLPAWSAASKQDLSETVFGVTPAGEALRACFPDADTAETVQVAVARFNRKGFDAAALTVRMMGSANAPAMVTKNVKTTTINFKHPYAVVAVPFTNKSSSWNGVPAFTAWVVEADSEIDA